MDAKKCDRCGNFYKSNSENVHILYGKGGLFPELIRNREHYDLCKECAEDFEKWVDLRKSFTYSCFGEIQKEGDSMINFYDFEVFR